MLYWLYFLDKVLFSKIGRAYNYQGDMYHRISFPYVTLEKAI